MIQIPGVAGLPIAVLGLGKSGLVAARALAASGARVRAWDDNRATRETAAASGIEIVDLMSADWTGMTALVISPGIPHDHPKPHAVAALARQRGASIIGDIELLARARREATYIGITGTNGKSTTTALIGHVLKTVGRTVQVGGNIGNAALGLDALGHDGIYVLELSSYQLETTPSLVCDVAVLLNITPDHLDRHGGMDGYIAAKRLIFRGQDGRRTAVVGVDDETTRGIKQALKTAGAQNVVPISSQRALDRGVYIVDGILFDTLSGARERIADLRPIGTLPGAHNWQNAAAAYAAARAVGVPAAGIAAALATYPGLPHRQELVGTIDDVRFVNDSKATNADAAARALGCYDHIYWIAGGLPKEGGIDSLGEFFPRIRHAYLIGQAAQAFATTLAPARLPVTMSGDLGTAVRQASADAFAEKRPGAVVLLSPACASFDQFANFEARGTRFRELVAALAKTPAGARA
jgi:UDP-N-acetylmuramoylalanine--D-glutamate ligase